MPHNLETLCLCYANQTSSEVPISSSNRDTVQKGGETAFSFPRSSLPRCRVIITQREVLLRLGIRSDANAARHVAESDGNTIQTLEALGQDRSQNPCKSSEQQVRIPKLSLGHHIGKQW